MEEGQQNPSRSPTRLRPMTDERSDRYPQFPVSFVRFKGCEARAEGVGGGCGAHGGFGVRATGKGRMKSEMLQIFWGKIPFQSLRPLMSTSLSMSHFGMSGILQ